MRGYRKGVCVRLFELRRLLPVAFFQFQVLHTTVHLKERMINDYLVTGSFFNGTFRWLYSDILECLFVCHW